MKTDYQIEDLAFQSDETVTYRARSKNGRPHTITRINLQEKILTPLREGLLGPAHARLLEMNHGCLRAVVDGGLDPVDKIPWVATRWWEGKLLSDQIKNKTLTGADISLIRFHAEALIHDMGDFSGALSFDPRTIVTTRSLEGEKVCTFEFHYSRWFTDWARGYTPGARDDAYANLNNLISKLEDDLEAIERTTAAIPQSSEPADPVPVLQSVEQSAVFLTPPSTVSGENPNPTPAEVNAPGTAKPALSPVTAPTSDSLLLSAAPRKTSTPKKMAFIGTAVAAIVISAIILGQQDALASSATNATAAKVPPTDAPPPSDSNNSLAKNDRKKSTSPAPGRSPKKKNGLPKRPQFSGEMLDIDADNEQDLADNIGKWVVVRGKVSTIGEEGAIHFKDSPLLGFPLEGSVEGAIGSDVLVTGILTSKKTLRIEKHEDISGPEIKKIIYTIEDESLLRTMEHKIVTVRAHAKGYAESGSGNTLYLIFHEDGPGFRAGISPAKTGSSTNEEYLRQFIGKEILVTGKVSTFEKAKGKSGKRLVIRFNRRANIKLAQ